MKTLSRRYFIELLSATAATAAVAGLAGCANSATSSAGSSAEETTSKASNSEIVSSAATESTASGASLVAPEGLAIDSTAWNYNADDDVYYQIGVPYCTNPASTDYETMAIYVPGAYFEASENGDDTYTCTVNESAQVGSFSAATAPFVMPINTAGYSAQAAPTEYSSRGLSDYLDAGFIYVYAGCRGRDLTDVAGNAPWGVTDLKAAVRTLRVNASVLPGNTDLVFSFGHSGGGAQSAVLGATGDAPGYTPYLEAIGAAVVDANGTSVSDAINGAMCWCPITCLDAADAAYEWNMGQFATSGTRAEGTFTKALSTDLAIAYAGYINGLGLVDTGGNELLLEDGGEGAYCAGSYYEHLMGHIEDSLNVFLANTEFPYTPSSDFSADMGAGGGGMGDGPSGGEGGPSGGTSSGDGPSGERPSGAPSGDGPSGAPSDGGPGGSASSDSTEGKQSGTPGVQQESASEDSTTYETVADYIAHLNDEVEWVEYDEASNSVTVTSLEGFAAVVKAPTKSVGAFDDLDRGQAENYVFGNGAGSALHFDILMGQLMAANTDAYSALDGWNDSYPADYANDIALDDELGNASLDRQNLYNPLYYLAPGYEGAGTSTPAAHWRIRTGITQGDTSLCTEVNLATAAAMTVGASSVDFETVWGKGHTTAESTGDSTENFIAWVTECAR